MSLKSKLILKIGLSNLGTRLHELITFPFFIQSLIDFNNERKKLLLLVKNYTHVNYKRLRFLYDIANNLSKNSISGAFVETGVWKGGCAGILSYVAKKHGYKNQLYFFDSFEGLPEPTSADGTDAIKFADGKKTGNLNPIDKVSVDDSYIKHLLFEILDIDPKKVNIVKGWFQNTLRNERSKIGEIALLRLDGDWYESTKIPLEKLYDLVVPGGYIVIDDYYYWGGCKKAVDEFIADNNINVTIEKQDLSGAYFIKP